VTAERVDQRQGIVELVLESLDGWENPNTALEFGNVRWLPDLVHSNGLLLHLALEEIDGPWRRRLKAAMADGYKLVIACGPEALSLPNLELIQEIDGRLLLLDPADEDVEIFEYDSVADLVAMHELSLGSEGLNRLADPLFDRALECTDTYRKGLLFEQVLCLLFSQVSYLHVLKHRYINETEEIDIVLGNRATGALAGVLGSPIVLVSGKNQTKPVGAPDVRALRGNMGNRRGRCSFGVLASARALASTAGKEQTHATDDPTKAVALLSGPTIRRLIASSRLDEEMQAELMKAVME